MRGAPVAPTAETTNGENINFVHSLFMEQFGHMTKIML